MNDITLEEENLRFDFMGFNTAVKFDDKNANLHGLLPVDFVAENADSLYFIEVKDYQNPHPEAVKRRDEDRSMLLGVTTKKVNEEESLYCHKIGSKLKDSILRKYVTGEILRGFNKRIVYLFFVNFDILGAVERGKLKERISNHIPGSRRGLFPDMLFDLVDIAKLKEHGIICTAKQ